VDIETSADTDTNSNGYDVGWIEGKEWMIYTVDVDSSAAYKLQIRYASSASGSQMRIKSDEADITGLISLPSSGGNQNWNNFQVDDVILYKGTGN